MDQRRCRNIDPAVLRAPADPTGEAVCSAAYIISIISLGSQGRAARLLRWPLIRVEVRCRS